MLSKNSAVSALDCQRRSRLCQDLSRASLSKDCAVAQSLDAACDTSILADETECSTRALPNAAQHLRLTHFNVGMMLLVRYSGLSTKRRLESGSLLARKPELSRGQSQNNSLGRARTRTSGGHTDILTVWDCYHHHALYSTGSTGGPGHRASACVVSGIDRGERSSVSTALIWLEDRLADESSSVHSPWSRERTSVSLFSRG